jgi:flavin-dependent thymidylate synthase
MKITLAGFNVDVEILNDIKSKSESIVRDLTIGSVKDYSEKELQQIIDRAMESASDVANKNNLTPEVLSAAYARISRSPLTVSELRRAAREGVSRARRSNEQIIFGLGHKSIAEHAVFNFDVVDISRLATEFIQSHRLCSFTEKSQRYVRFEENVYLPPELSDAKLQEQFNKVVHQQFVLYKKLVTKIHHHLLKQNPDLSNDDTASRQLENLAGEDARYILPLATYTQFGMTLNARSLEWMALKANAHHLKEMQIFGEELLKFTNKYAPSLVKYTQASDDFKTTDLRIRSYLPTADDTAKKRVGKRVCCLSFPENGDDRLLAMLLFHHSHLPLERCTEIVKSFKNNRKLSLFKDTMKGLTEHDPVWREFETLNFDIEIILSASAYAQLKRHRLSTQLVQSFDPNLSIVIPDSIKAIGMQEAFQSVITESESVFQQLKKKFPTIKDYILTNSHCHRVLLHANPRELYHIARLRMDRTAQWEIRQIATELISEVSKHCPLTFSLACGKDTFGNLPHYEVGGDKGGVD